MTHPALADALWRAATYVSVCQLHLRANVLLSEPLTAQDVKDYPSGHWGTVPGTAWALAHTALADAPDGPAIELVPLLGAGHAGLVQLSLSWLTGELQTIRPQFSRDLTGLTRLCQSFPEVDGLGSEVSPLLLAGGYLGGRLGGCLSFAQGAGLDSPQQVIVPILGDGECETPTTAAAWLAATAITGSAVVPIVHVNGFRMGAASILGGMTDTALGAFATGNGWQAQVVDVPPYGADSHTEFERALLAAVAAALTGQPSLVFLRCVKGWSGPAEIAGRPILGTHRAHKTPLHAAAKDPEHLRLLRAWLISYRPHELFDSEGIPVGDLAAALDRASWHALSRPKPIAVPPVPASACAAASFSDAVTDTVRRHAEPGDFRLFSPDELGSNRLGALANEPWVTEVLAEEVLLEWLAGWTASGRRGLLVSYEAFAPLMAPGLTGHLKQRRISGAPPLPSLNLLLTSYGWHNVYSHGDPSLATTLLGMEDPMVRVFTPVDPARLAAVLDEVLVDRGRLNLVIAGKHPQAVHPEATIAQELACGAAIWPHLSDLAEPDLTIAVAGDLPAAVATTAVPQIREALGCSVRVVGLLDMTVLGDPQVWPAGLPPADAADLFGPHSALLVVTLGNPAAVWALLKCRRSGPVDVIGWREPQGPMPQAQMAEAAGLTPNGLLAAARRLLTSRPRR